MWAEDRFGAEATLSLSLPPALPSLSSPNGDKAAGHHDDHHDDEAHEDVGVGGDKLLANGDAADADECENLSM